MTKKTTNIRLPAEWEPQDAILLAWPHAQTDWQPLLEEIEEVYIELTRAILRYQSVLIATPKPGRVADQLAIAGIELTNVRLAEISTNDTWTRDYGPITTIHDGQPLLLNFGFNGWGLKFSADLDNCVTEQLHTAGFFGATPRKDCGLILEGGSIESDGKGTLLTTAECLLNRNRNPHLDKEQIEAVLKQQLGADHICWLGHGYLTGDDTDSHIDTLARLCPNDSIVYVRCNNPQDEHYSELRKMEVELQQLTTQNGTKFRLLPLPWPQAHFDEKGERLPATYANYLVINGAVLVPTYDDPADETAKQVIGQAYPERDIIGIDCRPIIRQHGSLHCISMQIPQGVMP